MLFVRIFACVPAFCLAAWAQQQPLADLVRERMDAARIPAVSVAVSLKGLPLMVEAFGFSDAENAVAARPESVFRLASISKPITAMTALSLSAQGKLDLDARVQTYLPSFPEKQWPVSTRQLLGHQAGIRSYQGDEFNSTRHYGSLREALSLFAGDPLLHEPGTKYLYSSYGFNLAGAVLEAAGGESYLTLVRKAVLEPAGVRAMRADSVGDLIPYRVRGYRMGAGGELQNCGLADTSNKLPGGGWVGTAEELMRIGNALLKGEILPPRAREEMWNEYRLKTGGETGYGLGWGRNRIGGERYFEHSGGQQGASTHWIVMPGPEIVVVVLANLESSPAPEIARALLARVLESLR